MNTSPLYLLLAGMALASPTTSVDAGNGSAWAVVNFHPDGAHASYGTGVGQDNFVGSVARMSTSVLHAAVWNESTKAWTDLNPGSADDCSEAFALHGSQQVGFATVAGVRRASLWSGSSSSWIDLHPCGALSSAALAVVPNQQAGFVEISDPAFVTRYHASLWSGNSNWIDLSPPGADASCVYAMNSSRQGGYVAFGNEFHASIWNGSSSTWTDLNPASTAYSVVYGMDDNHQVGVFGFGMYEHACLWAGTAASFIDLNPSGALGSRALATVNGTQAGFAFFGDVPHAGLWNGSSESWVDLHALLPPEFQSSSAESLWSNGRSSYILGYGFNSSTRRDEVILWIRRTSCPCDLNNDGFVNDSDFSAFVVAYDALDCASPQMQSGCPADFTGDGYVDDSDFSVLVIAYENILCP